MRIAEAMLFVLLMIQFTVLMILFRLGDIKRLLEDQKKRDRQ